MTLEELAGYIDLTLLRPDVTRKDMERFLTDAGADRIGTSSGVAILEEFRVYNAAGGPA